MFKFSCFHVNVQGNKAKKITQPSTETMARVLRDSSKIPVRKDPSIATNSGSSLSKQQSSKLMNVSENDILDQDSVELAGKLEDLNKKFYVEFDGNVRQAGRLRKSQSESVLCQVVTEGERNLKFSKSLNDSPNSSSSMLCINRTDRILPNLAIRCFQSVLYFVRRAVFGNYVLFAIFLCPAQANAALPATKHPRVACSFRDQSLFQIFQICNQLIARIGTLSLFEMFII